MPTEIGICSRSSLIHSPISAFLIVPPRLSSSPRSDSTDATVFTPNMGTGTIDDIWACDSLEKATAYQQDASRMVIFQNYVSSTHVTSQASIYIDSFNPKTGEIIGKVPCTPPEEVEAAIRAAKDAFPAWSKTSRAERSRYLRRISELIQENRELFAVWESIDQGKTLERARIEIDRAVSNFSWVCIILENGLGYQPLTQAHQIFLNLHSPRAERRAHDRWHSSHLRAPVTGWRLRTDLTMEHASVSAYLEDGPMPRFRCTAVAKPSEITRHDCVLYVLPLFPVSFILSYRLPRAFADASKCCPRFSRELASRLAS